MWPMIGLCQSVKYSAPSGPISKSAGRKLGSLDERIGSNSVPAKLAPLSEILYCKIPWNPITLPTSRLPCISSGKCRLERYSMPGHGRVRGL